MIPWLASSAWALDLEEARTRAAAHAIAVAQADAEADAAAAAAGGAVWDTLPAITATAGAGRFGGFTSIGIERPSTTQLSAGVSARVGLVDPAGWLGAAAARQSALGARAMVEWARVEARAAVTTAYAAAAAAGTIASALEGSAADAEAGAAAVEERVAAGLSPPADGARARAEAAMSRAEAERALADREAACLTLEALLRETLLCAAAPRFVLPAAFAPGEPRDPHPAMAAAEAARAAAVASRDAAGLALAPSLAAEADLAEFVASGVSGPGWSVGVEATWPLVGSGPSTLVAARAGVTAAELALEDEARQLALTRATAEGDLAATRRVVDALDAAVAASAEAWARTDEMYRAGLVDVDAWLGARRSRDEAAVARARADLELWAALAAVEAARGIR